MFRADTHASMRPDTCSRPEGRPWRSAPGRRGPAVRRCCLATAFSGTAARRDAGFTLIEQLVVIAVIAVSLAAIGSLMSSSSRGASRLEQRVSLLQATNNLLFDAMSSRDGLTDPRLGGAAWGHRWRMRLSPVQEDIGLELRENARWVPMREELVVQSPSGTSMRLQTVRLQRIPAR